MHVAFEKPKRPRGSDSALDAPATATTAAPPGLAARALLPFWEDILATLGLPGQVSGYARVCVATSRAVKTLWTQRIYMLYYPTPVPRQFQSGVLNWPEKDNIPESSVPTFEDPMYVSGIVNGGVIMDMAMGMQRSRLFVSCIDKKANKWMDFRPELMLQAVMLKDAVITLPLAGFFRSTSVASLAVDPYRVWPQVLEHLSDPDVRFLAVLDPAKIKHKYTLTQSSNVEDFIDFRRYWVLHEGDFADYEPDLAGPSPKKVKKAN